MTKTQKIIWQVLEKAECWQKDRFPCDHVTTPCKISCEYYKKMRNDVFKLGKYKCVLVNRIASAVDKPRGKNNG